MDLLGSTRVLRIRIMLKLLLLLAALATPTWGARIGIKSIECRVQDPKFTEITVCSLKVIGRSAKLLNLYIKLLQIPVENVTVSGELLRRGYNRPALYSFSVDACRFLDAKRRNPMASIVYLFFGIADHSNMNHSCPFDHDLIVKNVRYDESFQLPLYLRPGDYKLITHWHAYNVLRATIIIVFEWA